MQTNILLESAIIQQKRSLDIFEESNDRIIIYTYS